MKFDVVINTDDNYIQHCMAMLCSLYENNKEHHIILHVLMKSLTQINKNFIEGISKRYENECYFYAVDETPLGGVQFRKKRPLSKAAYYRLLLASILPQDIHTVLYLDCDIIILRDLSEVFEIELDNYALAASIDNFPYSQQHRLQLQMEADERTFCSGVMLVNLKYWRDNNCEPKLLEYAKRQRKEIWLHDQDVLNYLFKKKWFLLPPKWNRNAYLYKQTKKAGFKDFDYKEYYWEPMLFHYASVDVKPWYNVYTVNRKYYIKYLVLSGYAPIKFKHVCLKQKVSIYKQQIKYVLKASLLYGPLAVFDFKNKK